MAIEPTADERSLINQYGLDWIEANEDRNSAAGDTLRSYASSLEDDGVKATKAVQRLLSSGKGAAMTALEEHWSRVNAFFGQTNRAARVIASEILANGDTIVIGKHAAQGLLADLESMHYPVSDEAQRAALQERQAAVTRQALQENAATALTDTGAGAARSTTGAGAATETAGAAKLRARRAGRPEFSRTAP